ncbi:MAG: hypothetical protein U0230_11065 [Polyangiales bacterium]
MKTKKSFLGSKLAVVAAVAGLLLGAASAQAQAPVPSSSTPSMIGGQVVGSGRFVIGATTGYPETQLRLIWGLSNKFDIGFTGGLSYGTNAIAGIRQRVGGDFQVPLRWTLATKPKFNVAIRAVPYFRIGQYEPAFGFGGVVGARFGIPLPKVFTLIVGFEQRLGFGSYGGQQVCTGFGCTTSNRFNFFDGASYAVFAIESFFKNKWFFNLEFDGGGYYGSNNAGGHGLFNAHVGFGVQLH